MHGTEIKIVGIFADDMSGVGNVAVSVHEEDSISKFRVQLKPRPKPSVMIKPGFDVQQNVWEGSFKLMAYHQPGHWRIERVLMRDNANNYSDYRHIQDMNVGTMKMYFVPTNPNAVKGSMSSRFEDAPGYVPGSETGSRNPWSTMPRDPQASSPASGSSGSGNTEYNVSPAEKKVRRVDMIPPHPPRGACLNCHEP